VDLNAAAPNQTCQEEELAGAGVLLLERKP
jgi:hypothetical protein